MAARPRAQGQNIYPESLQWKSADFARKAQKHAAGATFTVGGTVTPPVLPSPSDVMTQVETLEQAVDAFTDELQALEDKVGPVLRPCPPDGVNESECDTALAPLALQLRDISRQLAGRLARLREIRQQIDL